MMNVKCRTRNFRQNASTGRRSISDLNPHGTQKNLSNTRECERSVASPVPAHPMIRCGKPTS